MRKLPLNGIRVVDFGLAFHGGHVSQWLAVMGAEVIKIESNLFPDMNRTLFKAGRERQGLNQSVENSMLNYGKLNVSINMTKPKGLELVKDIVKLSDVVADNRGPFMERFGLGYEDLKKLKPNIIVYSGSGYGKTGPYKDLPAYAPVIDAFSGFDYLVGFSGGQPEIPSYGWGDLIAAKHAVFAIMVSLYHRSKTGEGNYIDLSMSEASLAFLPEAIMDYTMNERIAQRVGNRDNIMAPHGCYRCQGADKWVAIAVSNDEEWAAFCNALGNPDWTNDSKFKNALDRWKNQDEMDKMIGEWTIQRMPSNVVEVLRNAGVMAGECLDMEGVINNPQLKARDFFVEKDHPEMGKLVLPRLPWRLNNSPEGNYEHAPLLGEHNEYIFTNLLGLSKQEIKNLQDEKVIY